VQIELSRAEQSTAEQSRAGSTRKNKIIKNFRRKSLCIAADFEWRAATPPAARPKGGREWGFKGVPEGGEMAIKGGNNHLWKSKVTPVARGGVAIKRSVI